ncbi:GNAT family N-acetyltransferase [Ruminococcus sp.]|uniref:GNAT family N-acetyltransferase n=1 Tax=Ruminococcus sp. TaxID=41978 RepID=UPI0025EBBF19|nr:GNAT family N-acetyltransferase [Ruminococcus sp.]
MSKIKNYLFDKFCRFFHTELINLESNLASLYENKIKAIQAESKQQKDIYDSMKKALNDKNHIIVGIGENKKEEEVLVIQFCYDNNITFKLYSKTYSAINNHPRIMATIEKDFIKGTKSIKIDDILVQDNNIGNGSILMPYFLDYCKETGAEYISGWLSDVDSDHFDRSIHFYEKHGFTCKLNESKTSGSIRYKI